MTGRTEIHFHLLPGVDDGPSTMDASLELARLAVDDGTRTIVNTPHVCDIELDELEDRLTELRSELDRHAIGIQVLCGGEIGASDVGHLSDSQLQMLAQGPRGARWLLLESPHAGDSAEFAAAADQLRARGFGVVIAHPERSGALGHGHSEAISRQLAAGCWLQLNVASILGDYGEEVRAAAFKLLERDGEVVVSSDAHGLSRPPALTEAARAARRAGVARPQIHRAMDHGPGLLRKSGIQPS